MDINQIMQRTKSRSKKSSLILAVGVLIVLLLCFAVWLRGVNKKSKSFMITGNVDIREANAGFRVSGKVAMLYKEEGDIVVEGEEIARLDDAPFVAAYRAGLAEVKSSEALLVNAEALHNRSQALFSDSILSAQALDEAIAELNVAKARLEGAKAVAEERKIALDDTVLRAPRDGVVLNRVREEGEIVQMGQVIYTVSVGYPVWIRGYVEEPELGRVSPGMKALIHTDSKTSYNGIVGFISPRAEFTPKTVESRSLRSDLVYRIRIYVTDADTRLKQGMPVTIRLLEQSP